MIGVKPNSWSLANPQHRVDVVYHQIGVRNLGVDVPANVFDRSSHVVDGVRSDCAYSLEMIDHGASSQWIEDAPPAVAGPLWISVSAGDNSPVCPIG